jgi:hypothetical protein
LVVVLKVPESGLDPPGPMMIAENDPIHARPTLVKVRRAVERAADGRWAGIEDSDLDLVEPRAPVREGSPDRQHGVRGEALEALNRSALRAASTGSGRGAAAGCGRRAAAAGPGRRSTAGRGGKEQGNEPAHETPREVVRQPTMLARAESDVHSHPEELFLKA